MGETALDLTKNLDTMNTMWGNEIRKNKFKCMQRVKCRQNNKRATRSTDN